MSSDLFAPIDEWGDLARDVCRKHNVVLDLGQVCVECEDGDDDEQE